MKHTMIISFKSVFILFFLSTCTYDKIGGPETYAYNHNSTILKWTAYKYTSRIGVSGTFAGIEVCNYTAAGTFKMAVENATFTIDTETIDTGSEFRDANILNYFFNQLEGGETISGKVSHCEGGENEGIIYIDLIVNGIERQLPFDYHVDDMILYIEGDFNLADFAAGTALDYMLNCCETLHTGPDGIHRLWPDIHLEISTDLSAEFL